MPQFTKKPVTIEAHQWFKNGDHPEDGVGEMQTDPAGSTYERLEGAVVRFFRHPDVPGDKACEHCGVIMHNHGWIDTLEGGHIVCPGDYVITGVEGERYPCKPGIFAKSYDEVDEDKKLRDLETRRALLQTVVEASRGNEILDRQLKHGQFHSARGTLATLRQITKLQDTLLPKVIHA